MKKIHYFLLVILAAFFFSAQVKAAEETTGQDVYELGEVVVSASRLGVESVGSVREITAEDIEISGVQTLDEALNLLPGINIVTGGQGVPRIDMRGMRPRHVILVIDGIPFNSAGDGQFDPRLITTENIAKIKVSYGNDSVLYGPGGLGGVINVVTKKGMKKTEFDVSAMLAQKDDREITASLSGGNDYFDFFISAKDYQRDGYRMSDDFSATAFEDGGSRNNSDFEQRNFFGNIGFSPNDKIQVGIIFSYFDGMYGIPPSTLDDSDPFGKKLKYERVDDRDGTSISISGSYDITEAFALRGWIYDNNQEELINGYDDNTYTKQVKNKSYRLREKTDIDGGSLQIRYYFAGSSVLSFSLGTKEENFGTNGWEVGKSSTTPVDEEHEITTDTVSIEYEFQPFTNMGFVAGYGYSWFKKEDDLDDNTDNFLIGLNYDISTNSRIRASVADKVRFPSVTQLYGVGEANPNLTYEKSLNYELGFDHNMSQYATEFSLTGFRRDVEGYIAKDFAAVNQNNEEYLYQGVEITATNQSIKNLGLRLAYTYMDTEDKSTGSLVDEVRYNPQHKLALEGTYDFAYDISAYASIERIENQYYYNNVNTLKGELPDYTVVNLKIEKRFLSKSLKIFIGADNLLDENYFESYALPREGRSIYASLSYSIR